ncbi:hypothetical protein BJ741DRAFT_626086 [Chytriomyces cf. hyalinus JEL632]|nr:hypothetical protein BJ741DRAFT_626086 [Chytriomyces cf. hyalinus JEL632]
MLSQLRRLRTTEQLTAGIRMGVSQSGIAMNSATALAFSTRSRDNSSSYTSPKSKWLQAEKDNKNFDSPGYDYSKPTTGLLKLKSDSPRKTVQLPPRSIYNRKLAPHAFSKSTDNTGAVNRVISLDRQPLISADDVKMVIPSEDGYAVASDMSLTSPAENLRMAANVKQEPVVDVFDKFVDDNITQLNPPDWAAFHQAVKDKDTKVAYLKFKDILLYDDSQRQLITVEHLKSVIILLRRWRPFPKIKYIHECIQYVEDIGVKLDTDTINVLLDAYSRIGDQENARKTTIRLTELGLTPNLATYNLFLQLFIAENNYTACTEFYSSMIDEGIEPNTDTFNSLIQGGMKFSKFKRAEEFFQEMVTLGIEPNQRTINLLIQLYSRFPGVSSENAAKKIENESDSAVAKLQSLHDAYIKTGRVSSNAVIDTSLIKAFTTVGRVDLAEQVFQDARNRFLQTNDPNVRPDSQMYTTLLNGYIDKSASSSATASSTDADIAAAVSSTANAASQPLDSSSKEYSAANAQFEESQIAKSKAIALFDEMISDDSIEVDSIAFATILKMFTSRGDMEQAESIAFVSMRARNIPLTTPIWASLVEGYTKLGNIEDAVRIFETMRMEGISPPRHIYNEILRGLAADFDMELLERYWARWIWSIETEEKTMAAEAKGGKKKANFARTIPKPDSESYQIVLEAFIMCQDVQRAKKEMNRMIANKLIPTNKTFVGVFEAQVRQRDYQGAVETMLQMRNAVAATEKDVKKRKGDLAELGPHQMIKTHRAQFEALVVQLLGEAEEISSASEKAAKELLESTDPMEPVHGLRNATATALSGGMDDMKTKRTLGIELYKEMIAAQCAPSEETFRCVINAHYRAKDLISAIKTWTSFRTMMPTVVPNVATVKALLACIRDEGKESTVKAVFESIKNEKLPLDREGFAMILNSLARWGFKEEIIGCVLDMVNADIEVTPDTVQEILRGVQQYRGANAGQVLREVTGFLEESWPEAMVFEGVEAEEAAAPPI